MISIRELACCTSFKVSDSRYSMDAGCSVDSSSSGVVSDHSSVTMTTSLHIPQQHQQQKHPARVHESGQQNFASDRKVNNSGLTEEHRDLTSSCSSVHWGNTRIHHYNEDDMCLSAGGNNGIHNNWSLQRAASVLDYGPIHPYMSNSSVGGTCPVHHLPGCRPPRSISSVDSLPSLSSTSTESTKILQHTPILLQSSSPQSCAESAAYFSRISDPLLSRIFSHLPVSDLCRITRVCKRWYTIAWSPELWRVVNLSRSSGGAVIHNTDQALRAVTKILSYSTYPWCLGLERLVLVKCQQLTDRGLLAVTSRCLQLRFLDIRECRLLTNRALFEVITKLSQLEVLKAAGCSQISCVSYTSPRSGCQPSISSAESGGSSSNSLRSLDLSACPRLDDTGLSLLMPHCGRRLHHLYLRRCPLVGNLGLVRVAHSCPELREVSLSECPRITDTGLEEFAVALRGTLRYLSVAKCTLLTDTGISKMAACSPRLRYLNLRGCPRVTDLSLDQLAACCANNLESVDLGGCDVSDDGLVTLGRVCSRLRRVSLAGCDAVTDTGVLALAGGPSACRLELLSLVGCAVTRAGYIRVGEIAPQCTVEHNRLTLF